MNEIWKSIPGYEDIYEASSLGRVRSLARTLSDGRKWKARILKQVHHGQGYLLCVLSKDGKTSLYLTHRLIMMAFDGPISDGYNVHHNNNDRTDNRLENLSCLPTGIHNGLHYTSRKPCCGENIGVSKLTERDVIAIRAAYATGKFFHRELAKLFGVHKSHISRIINRKSWTHIPPMG